MATPIIGYRSLFSLFFLSFFPPIGIRMDVKLSIMVRHRLCIKPQGALWLQVVYVSPTNFHLPLDNCISEMKRR